MIRRLAGGLACSIVAAIAVGGEPSPADPGELTHLHVGSNATPAATLPAPAVTVVLGAGAEGGARAPALLLDPATVAAVTAPAGPWAGARWVPLSARLGRYFGATAGVLVIEPPALAAPPLEPGDVITAIGGRAVSDPDDLIRRLRAVPAGAQVALTVLRDHVARVQSYTVPADPSAGPPAAPRAPATPLVPRGA